MIDEFENLSLPVEKPLRTVSPIALQSWLIGLLVVAGISAIAWFVFALRPVSAAVVQKEFAIAPGERFSTIAEHLESAGVIRSRAAFIVVAVMTGSARRLQAGAYLIATNKSTTQILGDLVSGAVKEIEVVIPPGATTYDIDDILAKKGIVRRGELLEAVKASSVPVEGYLFPDTYRFFSNTPATKVIERMRANFMAKAGTLLEGDSDTAQTITLASLLEKEVPDLADRKIAAGIILKRIAAKMPVQIDATVCYVKEIKANEAVDCLPLTALDLKSDSPYNTYLHVGWPPGPIGNPGFEAIQAALSPSKSPYWYYLSDPATGKTIFSVELDEHAKNRKKYLQ